MDDIIVKVWKTLDEISEKQKEFQEAQKELQEARKESDRKFQESNAEFDKRLRESGAEFDKRSQEFDRRSQEFDKERQETEKQFKETDKKIEATRRLIQELSRKWGNTAENIGFSAEVHFQTALAETLNFANIQFDDIMTNVKRSRHGKSCEFDIMLINHDSVAIIEVKHRVQKPLPEKMVQQKAREFRTFFHEYKDYALYLGVAGMSIDADALEEAKKYGIGVLTQKGGASEYPNISLHVY